MQYLMTDKEKRSQNNLIFQLWRVSVLSLKFMKLMRMGGRPAKEHHFQHAHPSPTRAS